ncbi:MAG TPA: hypothetical protein VM076_09245, partial [Gemmatimonadaceae bacterium]|nr:hypothetical protein [Gemmatimonadaceae bacterium]
GTFAARAYRLVGGTDVSLAYRRDGAQNDVGFSLSRVFGESLELHAEVARTTHVRAVIGGQYTLPRNVNVVVELYHGTDGLTAMQWNAFRDSVAGDLRGANARYVPLTMARTYALTRIAKPFSKVETELITITNLRDGSTLVRGAATVKVHPNLALYVIDTELVGGRSSELEYLQVERITSAGLRVYF